MKSEFADKYYKVVDPADASLIWKAENIENINFPPTGNVITLQTKCASVPAIFGTGNQEVIIGKDINGNEYHITPRHITGEIFINGRFKRINELFEGTLDDFLKTMPRVRLVEFQKVEVDKYEKDGTRIKNFPIYELVK